MFLISGCLHSDNNAASGVQITPPPSVTPPSTLTPAPSGNYAATATLRQPLQAWVAALADGTSLSISIATGADRAPSVLISIGQRGTSTIALGATAAAPVFAAAYQKPDFLLLDATGGMTASNANASAILIYDLRHSKSGTMYTHYLGAEYAALALRYGGHHTPTMYRAGNPVPAAYNSTIAARYHIPVGAAYGHIKQHGANTNAVFVHNLTAGMLDADFANDAVTLNLTLAAAGNSAIYGIADWRLALSPDGRTFGNHACPSSGGAAASGCGGTVVVSDTSANTVEVANDAAAPARQDVDMFGGFYGNARQEFALAMHHILADYTFAGGVLGRDGGMMPGPPPNPATITIGVASQALFAAFADGTTANISILTDSNGKTSVLVSAGTTLAFGAEVTTDAANAVPYWGGNTTIAMLTNGIDVTRGRSVGQQVVIETVPLYRTPADLLFDAVGGEIVTAGASATLIYAHHFFKQGDIYTHYLGAEYAAFALRYEFDFYAVPTVFHGGVLASTAFFTATSLSSVNYVIPAGAAYGYLGYANQVVPAYNLTAGTLGVDFSNNTASLNLTVIASHSAGLRFVYGLANWEMALSADKRTFSNLNCPSSGGVATSGCSGTIAGNVFVSVSTRNNAASTSGSDVNVYGAFYGNKAQEIATALYHKVNRNSNINIGILGRKANADAGSTGASGTSAPAGALAAFPHAEFAAFTSVDTAAMSITHSGSRTPQSLLSTMSAATYRIATGKAGGVYTAANGAEMVLANTGAGDELRGDFASGAAVLDLAVGDSTGAHGYVLDDVGLELLSSGSGFNFCTSCTGSVTGSGALSGFNAAAGLQVDGGFYGANAEEAAAVLRHTAEGGAGALEMGFVGVR